MGWDPILNHEEGSKKNPSWEKAEKLKNLKVKTIRPKTWHGLRQDGAGLLNEVPLQASLREHISSATAPQRIRDGCTASMPTARQCASGLFSYLGWSFCLSFADLVPTSIVLRTA